MLLPTPESRTEAVGFWKGNLYLVWAEGGASFEHTLCSNPSTGTYSSNAVPFVHSNNPFRLLGERQLVCIPLVVCALNRYCTRDVKLDEFTWSEKGPMSVIYRYCCGWCCSIYPLNSRCCWTDRWSLVDDSDDEFYDPLMDDNESNAISELLGYLENVWLLLCVQMFFLTYTLHMLTCVIFFAKGNWWFSKLIGNSLITKFWDHLVL